jgi:ribosomal protein L3 glutamine methyltransferase
MPHAMVDAVDISSGALEVADKNAKKHHVSDRVNFIQSDLFNDVPVKQYDVIISNPPYVDAQDMSQLPAEYQHEPRLALAAGVDGLDIVNRMLHEASAYLAPKGVLIVEVGNSAAALEDKYPTLPFTWLEFERGGEGAFVITAEQLKTFFGESNVR